MAAAAPAHVKEGLPCVAELCIGDDVLQLAEDLAWQPVVNPANGVPLAASRVSTAYLDHLKLAVRGPDAAVEAVAPYWVLRRFDADGLRALSAIRAICGTLGFAGRLQASYLGGAGELTEVGFEPIASADAAQQRFRIVEIRRFPPPGTDAAQLQAIAAAARSRYAGLAPYAASEQPAAAWVAGPGRAPHLRLLAPTGDAADNAYRLRQHPDCVATEPHD